MSPETSTEQAIPAMSPAAQPRLAASPAGRSALLFAALRQLPAPAHSAAKTAAANAGENPRT